MPWYFLKLEFLSQIIFFARDFSSAFFSQFPSLCFAPCILSENVDNIFVHIQGDQLNMALCFWYRRKRRLVQCTLLYTCTLEKSRYQKNTAMFNWSPCSQFFPNFSGIPFRGVAKQKSYLHFVTLLMEETLEKVYIDGPCELLIRRSIDTFFVIRKYQGPITHSFETRKQNTGYGFRATWSIYVYFIYVEENKGLHQIFDTILWLEAFLYYWPGAYTRGEG